MTGRGGNEPTLVLVAGTTRTATIPGISAAGADPEARRWTPTADAEILTAGTPATAPTFPRSPTGCPTPAVVTRAVRELVGFDVVVVDAGLAEPAGIEVVDTGTTAGGDIRGADPVPDASTIVERGREIGASMDADPLLLAETIPGGTTTAMGVLAALGEPTGVSSSLVENPLAEKRSVVVAGLAASDIDRGGLTDRPREAIRRMGDPVMATLTGIALGADSDSDLVLAGGTQLACVGALLRRADVDRSLTLATTSYVANDESATIERLAGDLDLTLQVTDPGFDENSPGGLERYAAGEAKEGVGMGGALALGAERETNMDAIADRAGVIVDRCLPEAS